MLYLLPSPHLQLSHFFSFLLSLSLSLSLYLFSSLSLYLFSSLSVSLLSSLSLSLLTTKALGQFSFFFFAYRGHGALKSVFIPGNGPVQMWINRGEGGLVQQHTHCSGSGARWSGIGVLEGGQDLVNISLCQRMGSVFQDMSWKSLISVQYLYHS